MKSKILVSALIVLIIALVAPSALLGQNTKPDKETGNSKKTENTNKPAKPPVTNIPGNVPPGQQDKAVDGKEKGYEKTGDKGKKEGWEKDHQNNEGNHDIMNDDKAKQKEMKKVEKMKKKEARRAEKEANKEMKAANKQKEKHENEKIEKLPK